MGWQLRPDAPTPPAGIGLITSGDRALLYAVHDPHDGTNERGDGALAKTAAREATDPI